MFLTLEGPDGAGKTTLAKKLAAMFEEAGQKCLLTREPGDSSIGPTVRSLVLEGVNLDRSAELFLFLADRACHVAEVVAPALSRGEVVVCDRYTDSTLVYQGAARGFEQSDLLAMNELATGGLMPDKTLLLDIDPRISLGRQTSKDRLDAESVDFHDSVRAGFLELAKLEPHRFVVLDATLSEGALAAAAWEAICPPAARAAPSA